MTVNGYPFFEDEEGNARADVEPAASPKGAQGSVMECKPEDGVNKEPVPEESEEQGEAVSVLVAEDNVVSRKLLEKGLLKAGYEVTCAENGRIALELFKKQYRPIVITDWMMPEMNGVDLCQAIRNHNSPGYVFIVLLTALNSTNDIIAGLEAGADDYLTKPFNQAELFARLKCGRRILNLERSLKKANEEIKHLSVTDPLTQTYNRSFLNDGLPQEIARAQRYNRPLSIIMCDIDHFKGINDGYGHEAGDLVLREFAGVLRGAIRGKVDWLARIGGEEFLVVLPESHLRGAHTVAERLRIKIETHRFCYGENSIRVTASFGVACYNPLSDGEVVSPEYLMKQADTWLYKSKDCGRNQVQSTFCLIET